MSRFGIDEIAEEIDAERSDLGARLQQIQTEEAATANERRARLEAVRAEVPQREETQLQSLQRVAAGVQQKTIEPPQGFFAGVGTGIETGRITSDRGRLGNKSKNLRGPALEAVVEQARRLGGQLEKIPRVPRAKVEIGTRALAAFELGLAEEGVPGASLFGALKGLFGPDKPITSIDVPTSLTGVGETVGELLPFLADTAVRAGTEGGALGLAFAVTAAKLGQAGPQVLFGEEAVTVPGAAAAGFAVGSVNAIIDESRIVEGGNIFLDLVIAGVDPDIAQPVSELTGIGIGIVEVAKFSVLVKRLPGGKVVFRKAVREAIVKNTTLRAAVANTAKSFLGDVGKEISQEAAQTVIEDAGKITAQIIQAVKSNKAYAGPDAQEVLDNLANTIVTSAVAFPLLALPGAVSQLRANTAQVRTPDAVQVRTPDAVRLQLEERGAELALEAGRTTDPAERQNIADEITAVNEELEKLQPHTAPPPSPPPPVPAEAVPTTATAKPPSRTGQLRGMDKPALIVDGRPVSHQQDLEDVVSRGGVPLDNYATFEDGEGNVFLRRAYRLPSGNLSGQSVMRFSPEDTATYKGGNRQEALASAKAEYLEATAQATPPPAPKPTLAEQYPPKTPQAGAAKPPISTETEQFGETSEEQSVKEKVMRGEPLTEADQAVKERSRERVTRLLALSPTEAAALPDAPYQHWSGVKKSGIANGDMDAAEDAYVAAVLRGDDIAIQSIENALADKLLAEPSEDFTPAEREAFEDRQNDIRDTLKVFEDVKAYYAAKQQPTPSVPSQDPDSPDYVPGGVEARPSPPAEAAKPSPAKQPWEMSAGEFEKNVPITPISKSEASVPVEEGGRFRFDVPSEVDDIVSHARKRVVERALREGRPVPPEVLADYPELAKESPPPVAKPSPAPTQARLQLEERGAELALEAGRTTDPAERQNIADEISQVNEALEDLQPPLGPVRKAELEEKAATPPPAPDEDVARIGDPLPPSPEVQAEVAAETAADPTAEEIAATVPESAETAAAVPTVADETGLAEAVEQSEIESEAAAEQASTEALDEAITEATIADPAVEIVRTPNRFERAIEAAGRAVRQTLKGRIRGVTEVVRSAAEQLEFDSLKAVLRGEQRLGRIFGRELSAVERQAAREAARAFREGMGVVQKKLNRFRVDVQRKGQEGKAARAALVDFVRKTLPRDLRGDVITQIRDAKDAKTLMKGIDRAIDVLAKADQRRAVKDLKKTIASFDPERLLPEQRDATLEILDSIQTSRPSKKTLKMLESRLAFVETHKDNTIPPAEIAELRRLTKTPVPDMTAEEIRSIDDLLKHEVALNKNANTVRINTNIVKAGLLDSQTSKAVVEGAKKKKGDLRVRDTISSEDEDPVVSPLRKFFTLLHYDMDMKSSILDGTEDGLINKVLFRDIRDGARRQLEFMHRSEDFIKERMKEKGIDWDSKEFQSWSDVFNTKRRFLKKTRAGIRRMFGPGNRATRKSVPLSSGRRIALTRGEMLSMVMHSRAVYNTDAILQNGLSFQARLSQKHTIRPGDIDAILAATPNEVFLVADVIAEYKETIQAPEINSESVKLDGFERAREPNHWRVRRNQAELTKNIATTLGGRFAQQTVEGFSGLKERVGGSQSVVLTDAFWELRQEIQKIGAYIGLSQPMRNARTLVAGTKFSKAVLSHYGKAWLDDITVYLDRIGGVFRNTDGMDSIATGALNRLNIAILGFNPFVIAKQPISFASAANEIELKYLLPTIVKVRFKDTLNEMRRDSAYMRERGEGKVTRELAGVANIGEVRRFFTGKKAIKQKAMGGLRWGDSMSIARIWEAVKLKVAEQQPGLTETQRREVVARETERIVFRTQPTWEVFSRSTMSANKATFQQLLTLYSSQRNKNWNMLRRQALRYKNSDKGFVAKARLGKNIINIVVFQAYTLAAIDEIRRGLTKRPDEKESRLPFWLKLSFGALSTAAGNIYILGDILNTTLNLIEERRFSSWSLSNPLTQTLQDMAQVLASAYLMFEYGITGEQFEGGAQFGEDKWEAEMTKFLLTSLRLGSSVFGWPLRAPAYLTRGLLNQIKADEGGGELVVPEEAVVEE